MPVPENQLRSARQGEPWAAAGCCHLRSHRAKAAVSCLQRVQMCTAVRAENICKTLPVNTHTMPGTSQTDSCPASAPALCPPAPCQFGLCQVSSSAEWDRIWLLCPCFCGALLPAQHLCLTSCDEQHTAQTYRWHRRLRGHPGSDLDAKPAASSPAKGSSMRFAPETA